MDRCIILHYVRNTFVYCIALYVCHRLTLLHIIPGFERRTTLEVGEFSEMIVD